LLLLFLVVLEVSGWTSVEWTQVNPLGAE